jgi:hypothetical protein
VGVSHVTAWPLNKEPSNKLGGANGLQWRGAKQSALRGAPPSRACILATPQTKSTLLRRNCRQCNAVDWRAVAWLEKWKSTMQRRGCKRSSAAD